MLYLPQVLFLNLFTNVDSVCMPVLRSLQPVTLELKKFSSKYPELFFKVRVIQSVSGSFVRDSDFSYSCNKADALHTLLSKFSNDMHSVTVLTPKHWSAWHYFEVKYKFSKRSSLKSWIFVFKRCEKYRFNYMMRCVSWINIYFVLRLILKSGIRHRDRLYWEHGRWNLRIITRTTKTSKW